MGKSLFGSKSKSKNTSLPWDEVIPYLTGEDGQGGVFPDAQSMYEQGTFNPQMQQANDWFMHNQAAAANDPRLESFKTGGYDLTTGARDVANGAYDTNFNPVDPITGMSVDLTQARASQGVLDPTRAMSRMLSGRPDNPYLDKQAAAITNQLTRNLNENVMPGIRSDAVLAGGYGGSRQGIAEGLAASRLNQDLAPALTGLYGGAFENAQNRMYGTATGLNDQAFQNSTNNANRDMAVQQFNANLGLQNNQQAMQRNQQNLGNRMQSIDIAKGGMGIVGGVNDMTSNNYQNYMTAAQMPQQYDWNNLNNYANLMYQGAALGGTNKGTQSSQPGIIPSILGTGIGIAGMGRGMGLFGG